MNDVLNSLGLIDYITVPRLLGVLRAVVLLGVGLPLARLAGGAAARTAAKRGDAQSALLARRIVFYTLAALVTATALHQMGFHLGVLLGAAGVLTVALGFASQTSASNLISGLFLIAERPFVVGDVITVEGTTGEILSIDLLSVKLRTFDNLFVRVPNEQIIKSTVTNMTRFPIRRADIMVSVAYKEDLTQVRKILLEIAARNPKVLDEPKPLLIFKGFGESSLDYQFSVWAVRDNFVDVRTRVQEAIKSEFDRAGIEIPFPHRTFYTGAITDPLPVALVEPRPRNGADSPGTAPGGDQDDGAPKVRAPEDAAVGPAESGESARAST